MISTTLGYIVLLLLIGIHQHNLPLLIFTFSYLIILLALAPYISSSRFLELIGLSVLIVVWSLWTKQTMEPFESIPTRPCKIYFTNDIRSCDQGDFMLSEVELNRRLEINRRNAENYRSVNPQLYTTVMSPSYQISLPSVTLYESPNYTGRSWTLGPMDSVWIPTVGVPNDSISSIQVGKDTRVYLYEQANYQGRVIDFVGPFNVPNLTTYNFNDIVTSIRIMYHPIANYRRLLNLQTERQRLGGQCSQEFAGWTEFTNHPVKKPSEIVNRGNLQDWAFCYRSLFDRNSSANYNVTEVASRFEQLRVMFGKRNLVETDQTYVSVPSNQNLLYKQASPEYIRLFFKNFTPDPPATCDNPAVDYRPRTPALSPQYGFEFGIRSPSLNQYILSSVSIIQTGSSINGYPMMYTGDYNRPDPNIFIQLLCNYKVEGSRVILVPKVDNTNNNSMKAYKFNLDLCQKLYFLSSESGPITLSFSSKINTLTNIQRSVFEGSYPFNIEEPYTKITIPNYNKNTINGQTNRLNTMVQERLTQIADLQSKMNINKPDDPDKQEGFIRTVYKLPSNQKIKSTTEMNLLETSMVQRNRLEMGLFKFLYPDTIWNYHPDIPIRYNNTRQNYATFQVYDGYLRIRKPGEYLFRILLFDSVTFGGIENAPVPLQYSIDILINDQVVTSLYYCSKYDECIQVQSSRNCNRDALCRFIPSWYQHSQNRNQSHHVIGKINITELFNKIKIRIVTNANLNESPYCRLTYKRVSDTGYYFRMMRYYWANIWQRYDDDIIFYKNADYSEEIRMISQKQKEIMDIQDRINLNNRLIETVERNNQGAVNSIVNALINQDASWLNALNIQKYLSQNNRLYVFFQTPRNAPILPTEEEQRKASEFNNRLLQR